MRAMLFPGQGAQKVGMGRDFHDQSAAAREVFERANEVLGMDLAKICFDGPEERLEATDVCQPAILVCSAAIVAAMEEQGAVQRSDFGATAGLSLGEYTALWFAGALTLEDAVKLVRLRGQSMQQASEEATSGMVSLLGADEATAVALCEASAEGEVLVPANFLSPGNIAVSGAQAALDRVVQNARSHGVKRAVVLKVAGAFHSELMRSAVAKLEAALAEVPVATPTMPVISNVTARPHEDADSIRQALARQVTSPVRWEASMRCLLQDGTNRFLEPGPGSVLTGLLRKIDKQVERCGVASMEELNAMGGLSEGAAAS